MSWIALVDESLRKICPALSTEYAAALLSFTDTLVLNTTAAAYQCNQSIINQTMFRERDTYSSKHVLSYTSNEFVGINSINPQCHYIICACYTDSTCVKLR